MIDFAWSEFVLIAIIALIFLGPKELILLCRSAGRFASKVKAWQQTFQEQIHQASNEIDHEKK